MQVKLEFKVTVKVVQIKCLFYAPEVLLLSYYYSTLLRLTTVTVNLHNAFIVFVHFFFFFL